MNAKSAKWQVDERGGKYAFCPGKATWDVSIIRTYRACTLAFHTGILPREGHFETQDELFVEAYPAFVDHYIARKYGRVWQDVNQFTGEVFKAIGKMFGSKK